jgi:hypothetical protein
VASKEEVLKKVEPKLKEPISVSSKVSGHRKLSRDISRDISRDKSRDNSSIITQLLAADATNKKVLD